MADKVEIEVVVKYDGGGGIDQAKEDLASLGDLGGAAGEGVSNVGEALSGLDKQFAESAKSAETFADSFGAIEDPVRSNIDAVSAFGDALDEHQRIMEDTGSTIQEQLIAPMEETAKQFDNVSRGAVVTSDSVGKINDTFGVFSASDWADQMHSVGLETWNFNEATTSASKSLGSMNAAWSEADTNMLRSSAGYAAMSKQGYGVLGGLVGPAEAGAEAGGGAMESIGLGEGIGGAFGAITQGLSAVAMPLFAVQMIGMMVGQVSQGIYDMAATAEGPAAHSIGTFTGTVDALGQSAQKAGEQFSEEFGQGVLPTLQAINYETSQGQGGLGGVGSWIGTNLSSLINVGSLLFGIGTGNTGLIKGGYEGLVNQFDQMTGQPLQYQGPGPLSQAQQQATQQRAQIPQTVQAQAIQAQTQADTYLAQAMDTDYLQQQDYLQASQQFYQRKQQIYNQRHPISQQQLQQDASQQAFDQQEAKAMQGGPLPYTPGSWTETYQPPSAWDNMMSGISKWWSGLSGGSQGIPDSSGCFPAGTRILMFDGTERPIESIRAGERVKAHNGTSQVEAEVSATMTFYHKTVYILTFENGTMLRLTDSHPISTEQGWKSLLPTQTAKENPGLAVQILSVGDQVYTSENTTLTLENIKQEPELVQVFNFTVKDVHTYYADGFLVHNMAKTSMIGGQIADQVSGIQLPHIDLSGMASGLAGAFSGIQLPHLDLSGIASGLGDAFSGISLPHIDLSGMMSGLTSAFSNISLPSIPDIGGMINSSLGDMFGSISLPSIPDIGGMLNSSLSSVFGSISLPSIPDIGGMINSTLSGIFGGISLPSLPDIGGMLNGALGGIFSNINIPSIPNIAGMINSALGGIFSGIQIPSLPNIAGSINAALGSMMSGIQIPFFAEGGSNLPPGWRIVGERGPELQYSPGGDTIIPNGVNPFTMGTSYSPIPLGSGGMGGGPQSINVVVQLDSQALVSAMGIPISQSIRLTGGLRAS